MDLEQKTFDRRNFSKVVIAGLGSLSLPLFSWAEDPKRERVIRTIHVYTTDGNNDSVYERIAQLRKYTKEFPEPDHYNLKIEKLETKVESFYTNPDEITIIDNLTGRIKNLVIGFKEPKKTAVYLEDGKPHEKSIEPYVSIGNRKNSHIIIGSTEKEDSPDLGFIWNEEFYRVQSRNGGYIVVDENKKSPLTNFRGDFSIYNYYNGKLNSIFEFDGGEIKIYCFP